MRIPLTISAIVISIFANAQEHYDYISGSKQYELTNHLGNVLATISDKKLYETNSNGILKIKADILSANDYYPFGMQMDGRSFTLPDSDYKFGFNGKESDDEVSGSGNQYDYGFRIYNPRIAKFLSVDPLTNSYPELTPYQFASNTPINSIDLDGLEAELQIVVKSPIEEEGYIVLLTNEELQKTNPEAFKKRAKIRSDYIKNGGWKYYFRGNWHDNYKGWRNNSIYTEKEKDLILEYAWKNWDKRELYDAKYVENEKIRKEYNLEYNKVKRAQFENLEKLTNLMIDLKSDGVNSDKGKANYKSKLKLWWKMYDTYYSKERFSGKHPSLDSSNEQFIDKIYTKAQENLIIPTPTKNNDIPGHLIIEL